MCVCAVVHRHSQSVVQWGYARPRTAIVSVISHSLVVYTCEVKPKNVTFWLTFVCTTEKRLRKPFGELLTKRLSRKDDVELTRDATLAKETQTILFYISFFAAAEADMHERKRKEMSTFVICVHYSEANPRFTESYRDSDDKCLDCSGSRTLFVTTHNIKQIRKMRERPTAASSIKKKKVKLICDNHIMVSLIFNGLQITQSFFSAVLSSVMSCTIQCSVFSPQHLTHIAHTHQPRTKMGE